MDLRTLIRTASVALPALALGTLLLATVLLAGDLEQDVSRLGRFAPWLAGAAVLAVAVLVGAMACYLNLSRRLELVIARAAGMSAWQFVAPAVVVALLLGAVATAVYNPVAALLQEQSKRLEDRAFNTGQSSSLQATGTGFWVRQKSPDGQSIINAVSSADQGVRLGGVTVFMYDQGGRFVERVEAKIAMLDDGFWRLIEARRYPVDAPPERLAELQRNLVLSHAVGTALTVQVCLGFLLTTVTIQMVPPLVAFAGWPAAFALLAVGPMLGILSIRRLRTVETGSTAK